MFRGLSDKVASESLNWYVRPVIIFCFCFLLISLIEHVLVEFFGYMATDGVVIDSNKLVIDQFIFDLGLVDCVNDTQPEDQAYVDADDGVYQSEVVLLLQILLIFRRAGHLGKEN